MHFVRAGGQGFRDRHDQHGLIARLRLRRAERHGAAGAGQRDLREFRLDAFAEFEPDFARRGNRAADWRRRLFDLGVGEAWVARAQGGRSRDSLRASSHWSDSVG